MHLVHCTMYLEHRALCGALCNVHMKDWDRLGSICHYVRSQRIGLWGKNHKMYTGNYN